jgi:hypothetical protein
VMTAIKVKQGFFERLCCDIVCITPPSSTRPNA